MKKTRQPPFQSYDALNIFSSKIEKGHVPSNAPLRALSNNVFNIQLSLPFHFLSPSPFDVLARRPSEVLALFNGMRCRKRRKGEKERNQTHEEIWIHI